MKNYCNKNIDNVNENIYRNCLNGKELYLTVKHNGTYYLNIKTPSTHEVCIQNLISINYICNDNVYMLNLSHQREKYKIKGHIPTQLSFELMKLFYGSKIERGQIFDVSVKKWVPVGSVEEYFNPVDYGFYKNMPYNEEIINGYHDCNVHKFQDRVIRWSTRP